MAFINDLNNPSEFPTKSQNTIYWNSERKINTAATVYTMRCGSENINYNITTFAEHPMDCFHPPIFQIRFLESLKWLATMLQSMASNPENHWMESHKNQTFGTASCFCFPLCLPTIAGFLPFSIRNAAMAVTWPFSFGTDHSVITLHYLKLIHQPFLAYKSSALLGRK